MTSDRSSVIKIGDKEYTLTLTTRATKEIAKKYGGLENLGDKLMKSENFEMAIGEIIWLLTLLANQSLLIHNLKNPKDKKDNGNNKPESDNNKKTDTISRSKITDVSYNSRMQMDGFVKEVASEKKDAIAKFALFSGHPVKDYLKTSVVGELNDSKTDNHDKMDLNSYFEITLTYLNEENETQRMMFTTTDDPAKFINFLKSNINK